MLREIKNAMNAMKGQGQWVAEMQEGVPIMEMVEVEEMMMAGEALTTSMEEVVSEVGAEVDVVTVK